MVKISDVAREAGVSTATVSRTLSGGHRVGPDLAARVHEAADRLGYEPNRLARSLRMRRSSIWALVISDIENPFFTAVARGVESVAQELGYSVLLGNSNDDPEREARYLRIAEQEQVAGVILSPYSATPLLERLDRARIPTVLIDRRLSDRLDVVTVDSEHGAELATRHLLHSGWHSPACITGPENISTGSARARGYASAMRSAGLGSSIRIAHGPFRSETGERAVEDLLAASNPPDAIFAANTALALGAMRSLSKAGVRIGRDMGMVMFDDAPWAPFVNPAVSVVAQPAYEVGEAAARLLAVRVDGETERPGQVVELQAQLIVRESSIRLG